MADARRGGADDVPSHGSLFTGAGLLDFGLHLAGWEDLRWCAESDDWRREQLLARRFPDARRYADVRAVGADAERVDLIAGGFPCKGASSAGKREGFGHPETVLWREMARAVRELRPRYVLVENVRDILSLHDGAVWGEVLGDLAALGFDIWWDCIPAAAVGAPHLRDRVFAVAAHPDRSRADAYAAASGPRATARERARAAANADGSGQQRVGDQRAVANGRTDARGGGEAPAEPTCERDGAHPGTPRRDASGDGARAIGSPGGRGASSDPMRPRLEGPGLRRTATDGDSPSPDAASLGAAHSRGDDRDRREPLGDAAERGCAVEWGQYAAAIDRWEQLLGRPAPEPLVHRMDDGAARRVEQSRVSALGDGVCVQAGYIAGRFLMELHEQREVAA